VRDQDCVGWDAVYLFKGDGPNETADLYSRAGVTPSSPPRSPASESTSRSGSSLFGARSSPGAWTYANDTGEYSRQVTLVGETTCLSHLRQR
jgi:hypothetical protein